MKTKLSISLIVAIALLFGASAAQAEILFSCDFENLTADQTVAGQDGWTAVNPYHGAFEEAIVLQGSGAINDTKYMSTPDSGSGDPSSGAVYLFDAPLTFTAADTAVGVNFLVYANHGRSTFGLMWDNTDNDLWGSWGAANPDGLGPYTRFRKGDGSIVNGDSLQYGHWYEVQLTMDFSQIGGRLNYEYKDLTTGETEFTTDGTFADYDMQLTPTAGVYTANGIITRLEPESSSYYKEQHLDNITIVNPVPEPSTMALLFAGAVGLLAYAWRKRK